MIRTGKLISFIFFLIPVISTGQQLDNTAVHRIISEKSYIRFSYDNDFFTSTDGYYSQGINLEVVSPGLSKFPLDRILIKLRESNYKYGVAVEHLAFTPSSIRSNEIIYGDRPFAACLSLRTFSLSLDTINHQLLSVAFNAGIIGSNAGGEWMQKTIHRNLNNIEPLGWDNQVRNDIIINYDINYHKLIASSKLTSLNFTGSVAIGTLHNRLATGMNFMFGNFINQFLSNRSIEDDDKTLRYKIYLKPSANFTAYDATLQGGVFNRDSPYTINASALSRFTLNIESGITFQYKKLYLEYFQHYITKEFDSGTYHRWGGIRIGYVI